MLRQRGFQMPDWIQNVCTLSQLHSARRNVLAIAFANSYVEVAHMMPNAHESQRNCRFKDILKA